LVIAQVEKVVDKLMVIVVVIHGKEELDVYGILNLVYHQ
jgi:hypothetical protein